MVAILKNNRFNLIPITLGFAGLFITAVSVIHALAYGDFSNEGSVLTSMPWGIVSLIDLYVGLVLISLWAYSRETNKLTAVIWMVLIIGLGNMISCLYLLKAVYESQGSNTRFWLGKESSGVLHAV